MNRLPQIDPALATGKAQQLLGAVKSKLGLVPNLTRVLANAPAALEGYLQLSTALSGGTLSAKVREQLALVVAQSNACDYCLSAHSFIGGKLGLAADQILDARRAIAATAKDDALLKLAAAIVAERGQIADSTLAEARAAGVSDAEIVEVVGAVALNIYTNYLNHVAGTVVDFPAVKSGELAAAGGTH